jgi:hypothetical protein
MGLEMEVRSPSLRRKLFTAVTIMEAVTAILALAALAESEAYDFISSCSRPEV